MYASRSSQNTNNLDTCPKIYWCTDHHNKIRRGLRSPQHPLALKTLRARRPSLNVILFSWCIVMLDSILVQVVNSGDFIRKKCYLFLY